MMELSLLELAIIAAAVWIAVALLRPYVPPWAAYATFVAGTLYFLVDGLGHGWSRQNAFMALLFAACAAHTWWRDIRGGGTTPSK